MSQIKILKLFSYLTFPVLVFLFSLFVLMPLGAYDALPWIDIPMHFIGGLSISYTVVLFANFFKERGFIEIRRKFIFFILVVSSVALIAILWEFYEFFAKYFFGISLQSSLEDTLLDLFMGLFGGLFGAVSFRKI